MRDGNDLMAQLIQATKATVPAGGQRYRLYKKTLHIFEADGYDTKRMGELVELDAQFADAYEYFYPRDYDTHDFQRDCMDYNGEEL